MKMLRVVVAVAATSLVTTAAKAQPPNALCVMGVQQYCAYYGAQQFGSGPDGQRQCRAYYGPVYEQQCDG